MSPHVLRFLLWAKPVLESLLGLPRLWIQPLGRQKVVTQGLHLPRLLKALFLTSLGPRHLRRILEHGVLLFNRIPPGLLLLLTLLVHRLLLRWIWGVPVKGLLYPQLIEARGQGLFFCLIFLQLSS